MRKDFNAAVASAIVTLLSTSALACEEQRANAATQEVEGATGVLLAQAMDHGEPVAPSNRGPKTETQGNKSAVIVNPDGTPASPDQPLAGKQVNKEEAQKLGQEVK